MEPEQWIMLGTGIILIGTIGGTTLVTWGNITAMRSSNNTANAIQTATVSLQKQTEKLETLNREIAKKTEDIGNLASESLKQITGGDSFCILTQFLARTIISRYCYKITAITMCMMSLFNYRTVPNPKNIGRTFMPIVQHIQKMRLPRYLARPKPFRKEQCSPILLRQFLRSHIKVNAGHLPHLYFLAMGLIERLLPL